MLRMMLFLTGIVLVVGAAFGLVLANLLQWIDVISTLNSLIGVVLSVGVVIVFALATPTWLSNTVLRGPFRAAARRTHRRAASALKQPAWKPMLTQLIEASAADPRPPGFLLAEFDFPPGEEHGSLRWPWAFVGYRNWLHLGVVRLRDSVVNRLLLPERSRVLADAVARVVDGFDSFLFFEAIDGSELRHAGIADWPDVAESRFSDFAMAFTGAVVLADAVQTRAGYPEAIKVWHNRAYLPEGAGAAKLYDHGHVRDLRNEFGAQFPPCEWESRMREQPKTRADDYDGRVLDLRAVATIRDRGSGTVNFVLLTGETCYAATEVSPWACKGLEIDDEDRAVSRWRFDERQLIANREGPSGTRLCLVTAFTVIVLEEVVHGKSRNTLVFSRRAAGVRNGNSVITMTGGGVMNLSVGGFAGDEDGLGFPDPALAVQRELKEELGVDVPKELITPVAIHVSNERGPATTPERKGTGQLVAAAAFVTRLAMGIDELRALRVHASAHNGRYESAELVAVSLPVPEDERGKADRKGADVAARAFARHLHQLSGELDQRAMLSALYVAANTYGARVAVDAFSQVWPGPWYEQQWSHDLEVVPVVHNRLARPLEGQLDRETFNRVEGVRSAVWPPVTEPNAQRHIPEKQ